jgi:hypothetical protein
MQTERLGLKPVNLAAIQDYTPPDALASEYQTIPLDKVEDFGVHVKS